MDGFIGCQEEKMNQIGKQIPVVWQMWDQIVNWQRDNLTDFDVQINRSIENQCKKTLEMCEKDEDVFMRREKRR